MFFWLCSFLCLWQMFVPFSCKLYPKNDWTPQFSSNDNLQTHSFFPNCALGIHPQYLPSLKSYIIYCSSSHCEYQRQYIVLKNWSGICGGLWDYEWTFGKDMWGIGKWFMETVLFTVASSINNIKKNQYELYIIMWKHSLKKKILLDYY